MLTDLHTFAISLIIGLLIGLEREQSHSEGTKTLLLLALMATGGLVLSVRYTA